jgi:hypothetical protein
MPIKQAYNSIIIKIPKPVSRAFNQLELIVDALHGTIRRLVVKVSNNSIKLTDWQNGD